MILLKNYYVSINPGSSVLNERMNCTLLMVYLTSSSYYIPSNYSGNSK
jgi:hypothetical protein